MAMDKKTIDQLAEHLENCQLHAKDTLKITDDHPDMDWKDAYDIQDEVLARKLRRGARVVGFKAGLTSHAKMKQMNVDSPVFGFLVDEFSVPEGGEVKISELIHPKVEAEICFITKHELRGPGCNIASVLAASDVVLPGIEVIDSRYRDFKFDLKSVVADNTSASRFVVGGQIADARSVDLRTIGVVFEINGEAVALGDPAAAVAMLVNHLGERGQVLPAGSLVLSGGVTEAIAVKAGDHVNLRIQGLGSVSLRFV